MQWTLMCLNPEEGPDFLAVYIHDMLVFSRTLESWSPDNNPKFVQLCRCSPFLKPEELLPVSWPEFLLQEIHPWVCQDHTQKDTKFHWTSGCQNAFKELNQKLATAPVIVQQRFCTQVDASIQGIKAVISR